MKQAPIAVSFRLLLAYYLIVPFCVGLALLDMLALGGRVRMFLPYNPENIFLYRTIMDLPHVIMSMITFAEAGYIAYYRRDFLSWQAAAFITVLAVCYSLGPAVAFIFYCVYNMEHLVSQQTGINLLALGGNNPPHTGMRWLMILTYSFVYVQVGASEPFHSLVGQHIYPALYSDADRRIVAAVMVLLSAAVCALGWAAARRSKTRMGSLYTGANAMLTLGGTFTFLMGYGALSVFMVTFIHSTSAITCYVVHDVNRNRTAMRNVVLKAVVAAGLPVAAAVFVAGHGVATVLGVFEDRLDLLITGITFLHYFFEGFMWKRGTPHRQAVPFLLGERRVPALVPQPA